MSVSVRVQPPSQKYSDFPKTQITSKLSAVSSHSRGVSRSSRTRGGMRWTQAVLLTRARACGRRSRVVLTPRRWRQALRKAMSTLSGPTRRCPRGDGDKTARSPGRARRKPLKPLRAGMPGVSGVPVASTPVLFCCTGGCGCAEHPAFPTPSIFGAENSCTARAPRAAETQGCDYSLFDESRIGTLRQDCRVGKAQRTHHVNCT